MKRKKMDMQWETFLRSLEVVSHFVRKGTQGELALTGVGEALLHERFSDAVLLARECIGSERLLTFSTNGILLSDELLRSIKPADPVVFISLHRPEVAGPAVERSKAAGIKTSTNSGFAVSALNWIGQVDWHVSHQPITCAYLKDGWAVIRADGTIGTCCWDAETEKGRIGDVWQDPDTLTTAPHKGCVDCSLSVPDVWQFRVGETCA